jgi:hypothetical protein
VLQYDSIKSRLAAIPPFQSNLYVFSKDLNRVAF